MAISEVVTSLSSNPYFGAGFGLFGVGAVAGAVAVAAVVASSRDVGSDGIEDLKFKSCFVMATWN